VSWKQVVKAATFVRDVLKTLGLQSWVKTTGGRGVHVVVPLKRKRTVTECLASSRDVSEAIAKTDPRAYATAFTKAGRERQILIDSRRNNRTNTSVCAFSPLTVPRRLERLRTDPWKEYWSAGQVISAASFAAVSRLSLT
jgi:bifunctional non-homologous end joining protein LigD